MKEFLIYHLCGYFNEYYVNKIGRYKEFQTKQTIVNSVVEGKSIKNESHRKG